LIVNSPASPRYSVRRWHRLHTFQGLLPKFEEAFLRLDAEHNLETMCAAAIINVLNASALYLEMILLTAR